MWTLWFIALIWLFVLVYNMISIKLAPRLSPEEPPTSDTPSPALLEGLPLVSVLVPARNEAGRLLGTSIRSILSQDYPNFEVIVVDDRSTDRTLKILEEIAAEDARLRVVRGEPLPAGWIGKPWALEQAKQVSRGTWLLATDADMVFHPQALRRAMHLALQDGLDAVTFAPRVKSENFWATLVMPIAGWSIMFLYPYWRVNNPASKVALAVGGFLLMRRDAHDRTGGYHAIRGDVTDDLNTAKLLKSAGFRLYLAAAPDLLWTPMYSGLKDLVEGFGKNAFVGSGGSLLRAVMAGVANIILTVVPLILLAGALLLLPLTGQATHLGFITAAAAAYLAQVAAFAPVYTETGLPWRYAMLSFAAHLVMVFTLLRSTWRMITGKGVVWKSRTLYAQELGNSAAD